MVDWKIWFYDVIYGYCAERFMEKWDEKAFNENLTAITLYISEN